MKTARAMRNASRSAALGHLGARPAAASAGVSAVGRARGRGLDVCSRPLSLRCLAQGVHDCLARSVEAMDRLREGPRSAPSTALATARPRGLCGAQVVAQRRSSTSHASPAQPPPSEIDSDPDSKAALAEQLRTIMRLVPSSVVVCTAAKDGVPRAMAMSSFTSLTLAPPAPLVTFNVKTPSRTLDAIAASGSFNIHVLAGDEKGAAIADRFTRGNADGDLFKGAAPGSTTTERKGGDGAPILKGEGVLYVLRCETLREPGAQGLMRVRDHVIVVGEVRETVSVAGGEGAEGYGLVYGDRQYRRLGDVVL